MAFCPKCEFEFEDDHKICPECKVLLVDQRPAGLGAAVAPDMSWVQICGVRSNLGAESAKGALDSSNIPSVIMSSKFFTNGKHRVESSFPGLGLYDISLILVPREFREEAEVVVEAALGDDWIPLDAR
jgi:hypothetical protein